MNPANKPAYVKFWVPGVPAPGGSKKAFRHAATNRTVVIDDAKGNRAWRARVALFATEAMKGRTPFAGPIEAWATFRVVRPKGHYGTGRNAKRLRDAAPAYPTTRPDATKLWRAAEDACTGVVWFDDSQVVAQHVFKLWGDQPGVLIEACVLC